MPFKIRIGIRFFRFLSGDLGMHLQNNFNKKKHICIIISITMICILKLWYINALTPITPPHTENLKGIRTAPRTTTWVYRSMIWPRNSLKTVLLLGLCEVWERKSLAWPGKSEGKEGYELIASVWGRRDCTNGPQTLRDKYLFEFFFEIYFFIK